MAAIVSTLIKGDRARFLELLRIYQSSIEVSEQKPLDAIEKLFAGDHHEFLIAEKEGIAIGFAMIFFPADVSFWLLDYMAIDRDHRSTGVGASLFAAAVAAAQKRIGPATGIMEIDKPISGTSTFDDALRRQRFYMKCGCRRIAGLDYQLPQVGAGTPPPMQLLLYQSSSTTTITKDLLRSWLCALYVQLYACSATDPRIDAMLQTLRTDIRLEKLA